MKFVCANILCLALCLLNGAIVKAQTFFEDSRGQTSINLPLGGIARLNTTASSLKIGYYYNRSDKNIVFGVDASGISNNGFAPLTTGKELSPEANLNFNIGIKNVSTDDSNLSGYDYLNIRMGIGRARYRLIDIEMPYDQQLSTDTFTKYNVGASYNYYLNGNMVFGAHAGYDRTNNTRSLNRVTIKEKTSVGNSSGGTVRTVESEYTAWLGQLKAVNQFSLFLDYVYIPDLFRNRVALSAYSRSYFSSIHNTSNAGIGLYLNRKGNPLKIVGGLIYEFSDVFNAAKSQNSLGERGTIGIVIGYNF